MNEREAEILDEEKLFGFVIAKESDRYEGFCYMVDRTYQKKKWWTSKLREAMRWNSEQAAQDVCDKLKYGNAQVYNRTYFHQN